MLRSKQLSFSREWLYWYDSNSKRFPAPENVIQQERQRAEVKRQRADRAEQQLAQLMAKLQERGIDLKEL
ncbi:MULTISPECIES: hypothetical protein [Cyanophyceae]|uniref:hypothetical protein n=1 Tax=Cyanophyceae TaxID=3028117 RepID=UPI00168A340A|nr:hypothetical protein [Trichocoleus sp. FACHB-69]MBD1931619.1 hypothetical protein [Trichocoleus sp. FACHB-69]